MTESNLLPRFHELLKEADEACDAVDAFDLDSNNAESRKQWGGLVERAREAKSELILYIEANAKELLPQILERS